MKRLFALGLLVLMLAGCGSAAATYGAPALDDYDSHYDDYDVSDDYVLKEEAVDYVWENCRDQLLDCVTDYYSAEDLFEDEITEIRNEAYQMGYDDAEWELTPDSEGAEETRNSTGESDDADTSVLSEQEELPPEEWMDDDSEYVLNYVLNTDSMVFHYPSCGHAGRIGSANKKEVETTRDQLVAEGYRPCGHCQP